MNTPDPSQVIQAPFHSEVWNLLTYAMTKQQLFVSWASKLQAHFDADEIAIWSIKSECKEPCLEGYACRTGFEQDPFTKRSGIEEAIAFTLSQRTASPIHWTEKNDVVCDAFAPIAIGEPDVVLFAPVENEGRIDAIFAVRRKAGSAPLSAASVASTTEELGTALSIVRRIERLGRTQRVHEALLHCAPVAVCCLDSNGNLTQWNPVAEQLFGWRVGEVLRRPLPIVRQREREILDICWRGALAGDATKKIELKCVARSGDGLWVTLSALPLYDETGTVDGVLLVTADITARKRLESRLRLQSCVTETLGGAPSLEDAARSILNLVCELSGWECGEYWTTECDGRQLSRRASARPQSAQAERFDTAIRGRSSGDVDDLVRRTMNSSVPIVFSGFSSDRSIDRAALAKQCGLADAVGLPIVDTKGTLGALLFFAENIEPPDNDFLRCFKTIGEQLASFARQEKVASALRAAEEKALQLQKLETVGTLVGGFVHDFNNLMTVILGYGDLLLDEGVDESLSREAVREIFDAAKQASTLTRRLLTIARKDAAELAAIDLNSVIERMESIIRRIVGKGIESEFCLSSDISEITAIPGQIEQLIMNLVMNARDAMNGQGQLTICTREITVENSRHRAMPQLNPGRYISLTVRDTGCGMDEVLKGRIFEPFVTTKSAAKGTGIGLSTVRDVVNRCLGHITVESTPGRGTTFELVFPRAVKGLECWVVTSAPRVLANGTETVVLVDEDAAIRRLISLVLKTRGYTVVECDNTQEAIRAAKRRHDSIDLLVIDLNTAVANSLEAVKRFVADHPGIRVLCLSALDDVPDGWLVLQKPFTSHELAAAVRETLAAKTDAQQQVSMTSLVSHSAALSG